MESGSGRMDGTSDAGQHRTGLSRAIAAAGLLALTLVACVPAPGTVGSVTPDAARVAAGEPQARDTIFYMTDRSLASGGRGGESYRHGRSAAMAFGSVRAEFGGGRDPVRIAAPDERLRFPMTPVPFFRRGSLIVPEPAAAAVYRAAAERFKAEVAAALRARGQRDVIVFVHGYRNSFGDSVSTLAGLWQAVGRRALPIVFSWPAGNPAPFGYLKDRESGEFSIFHLKETLRLLAEVDGLGDIQVVAHSRGTDVATSALREMVIAARAAGRDPRAVLKIDNLILAAPDLDFSVVRQRLIAEHFGPAFGRISVYLNPSDGTLALAQALMSGTRFGRLSYDDLPENEREIFRNITNVDFIDVSGVATRASHDYFRNNPRVMADIVTVLTASEPPESARRDLVHQQGNFWRIELPPEPEGERRSRDDRG